VLALLIPVQTYITKKLQEINQDVMLAKDARTNKVDEMLQGIRVVKFFGWEESFLAQVQALRESEFLLLHRDANWGILASFLWNGSPTVVALATFAAYSASGQALKPNVAFTALSLFNILRLPMMALPSSISQLVGCITTVSRLKAFLLADEIDPDFYERSLADNVPWFDAFTIVNSTVPTPEPTRKGVLLRKESSLSVPQDPRLKIMGGSFAHAQGKTVLRGIDIEVDEGELMMVCGAVGSGKSSLLASFLGETIKVDGKVLQRGSMAYASQEPWIMNASLRENILFGTPFDEHRYKKVLSACALEPDLKMLPAGDATEIGEKGINLSGGQKARVSLARACYQDADIYLLDDPLSAVDVHVARTIMEHCITGLLRKKSRVLVTHQVQYMALADTCVVLEHGVIVLMGPYFEGGIQEDSEFLEDSEEEEEGGEGE
ncbi:P-loop containing nucleoside triphosphate hydrolase protein, partial [Baffinella frigidus]